MSTAHLITRYPNRRLYDTGSSRYVTLRDVRDLVLSKAEFSVIDRKSGKDITRSVLLQVIADLEKQGEAVMSRDFLVQVIRSYGNVVPGIAAEYLEQSMKFFLTQQQNFRKQVRRVVGTDPFAAVADLAQKNIARWKALQEEVLRRFARANRAEPERPADARCDTGELPGRR
jgi:polyhydroxyalkanoate synthesis repressor PhaR